MPKIKLDNQHLANLYAYCHRFLLDHAEDTADNTIKNIDLHIRQGSIKLPDILALNEIIDIQNINSYLEVGSYIGFSFYMFMHMLQPKIGYSIDPNIKHRIFNHPRTIFNKLNRQFLDNNQAKTLDGFFRGHLQPTEIKIYTAKDLDRKFDCIFIDGAHDYFSVQQDFLEAAKVLNKNGIIVLHDIYSWDGVKRLCKDLDCHYDWSITRTPANQCIDGFAIVKSKKHIQV